MNLFDTAQKILEEKRHEASVLVAASKIDPLKIQQPGELGNMPLEKSVEAIADHMLARRKIALKRLEDFHNYESTAF